MLVACIGSPFAIRYQSQQGTADQVTTCRDHFLEAVIIDIHFTTGCDSRHVLADIRGQIPRSPRTTRP